MDTLFISRELAHYLLDKAVGYDYVATAYDHKLLDTPNPLLSFLLTTGVKLGRNYDGLYYISGYAQDGSDIQRTLDRYLYQFMFEHSYAIRVN